MNKTKVKEFWEKNKGKIIVVAGGTATISLAVIGCKVKRKRTQVVTTGINYRFSEPIALKDILTGNPVFDNMLDGLPEFLAQTDLTEDVLVSVIRFTLKEPVKE